MNNTLQDQVSDSFGRIFISNGDFKRAIQG